QAFTYDLAREMGYYAPRTQYVELFLNTDGSLNSADYAGLYVLMEKIKQDPNRVDIAPLGPNDNSGDAVTGGYLISFDKIDAGPSITVNNARYQFQLVEPHFVDATTAQKDYLTGYLTQLESALYGASFADPVLGYSAYLDPKSFVDNILMVEMAKN